MEVYKNKLESLVEKRTQELKAALAKAQNSDRLKTQFLENLSHEVRTPMNGILGLCRLTLQTDLNARQRDCLRKIMSAGESLLGVINDILDFSRIEAGKMTMEWISFDLSEVLERPFVLVGPAAEEKGLDMLLDLDPSIPATLVGDPLRLGQVLINLVNNAVKFTDEGQVILFCLNLQSQTAASGFPKASSACCSSLFPRPTAPLPASMAAPGWGWLSPTGLSS